MTSYRAGPRWLIVILGIAPPLLCAAIGLVASTEASAESTPRLLRVAPVWRATLSGPPNSRVGFYPTVDDAYDAYAAWVVTNVLPPVRIVVGPDTWPCPPPTVTGYYNGVPYAYCHHYERWYGTNLELSMTAGGVTSQPFCPEDYRLVYVVPPSGGSPFNVRVVCESWTPPPVSQCPPNSCNGLGDPIFPEDATKRQGEIDYQSPVGPLNFSRTFNSAQGAFFHSFQTPVRKPYDLGELAAGTANVTTGCLSSRVRIADGDGLVRIYPYCFTYLTDDGNYGRVEVRGPAGFAMVFSPEGNPLDPWNAGSQLMARGTGRALIRPLANTVEFYDSDWRMTDRVFADGQRLSFTYSGFLLVGSVSDQFGRTITLNHDGGGRLVSMVDPAGGTYTYGQGWLDSTCTGEGCQQLSSVTYPDLSKRVYHWNEPAYVTGVPPFGSVLLTGITDESNQRFATFSYSGKNAKSSERAGSTLRYQFSQFQREYTTVIDPLGNSRTYKFAAYGGLTRLWNVTSWCADCLQFASYDSNGNQTVRADLRAMRLAPSTI